MGGRSRMEAADLLPRRLGWPCPTVVRVGVELARLYGGVILKEGMGKVGREEVATRAAMVEDVGREGGTRGAMEGARVAREAVVGARVAMAGTRGAREAVVGSRGAMVGTKGAMVVEEGGKVTWLTTVEARVEELEAVVGEVEELEVVVVAGIAGVASWTALAATYRARLAASRRRDPPGGPGGWRC